MLPSSVHLLRTYNLAIAAYLPHQSNTHDHGAPSRPKPILAVSAATESTPGRDVGSAKGAAITPGSGPVNTAVKFLASASSTLFRQAAGQAGNTARSEGSSGAANDQDQDRILHPVSAAAVQMQSGPAMLGLYQIGHGVRVRWPDSCSGHTACARRPAGAAKDQDQNGLLPSVSAEALKMRPRPALLHVHQIGHGLRVCRSHASQHAPERRGDRDAEPADTERSWTRTATLHAPQNTATLA